MDSIARKIASNALALFQQPVSSAALEKVKLGLLDTLGVTLAGSQHQACAILRRVTLQGAASGNALVYGTNIQVNALDAALLNGTAAHMLDYDDSNSQLHGHLSAAILPALLATAQTRGSSGDAVARAYVTAFEAGTRIGMGVSRFQYTHGWHPTATVGIFPAVVGAGLLQGLGVDQLATALSIATSMAAGIKANFGSMTKPLHVGQASRNAVLAVQLAAGGFTAGELAFEHGSGYLNVFDRAPENYDAEKIVSDWGSPLAIVGYGFRQKQFACCYACLPPATALIKIQQSHSFRPEDVEKIEVLVHPIRFPHINNPAPATALAGKFSLHYCIAKILFNGKLVIEDFEGQYQPGAAVESMMKRTSLSTHDKDNIHGAVVRVHLKQGQVLEHYAPGALGGSYENPLPPEVVREKYQDCASRALAADQVEALHSAIFHVETLPNIQALLGLMAREEKAPNCWPHDIKKTGVDHA